MGCRPPGSSVHGIFQARKLEWVVISFSKGSSQPRDQTCISYIGRQVLNHCATREVQTKWKLTQISNVLYLGPNSKIKKKKKNLHRYKQNEKYSFTNQNQVWCGCQKKWIQPQVLLKGVSKPALLKLVLNSKPFLLKQTYADHQCETFSNMSLR